MDSDDINRRSNMSPSSCFSWSIDKVATELEKHGLGDEASIFKENGISGKTLPSITKQILEEMGISDDEKKSRVLQFLENLKQDLCTPPEDSKVFNDPIHGHIELHPLCVAIIDTPQFQRLRYIKQLGACYFVFPGASHNRFEHSIGVCHLAGLMGRELQMRQPELHITDIDILCLEIAGLCHDLGHGPFSHLFDQQFIHAVDPDTEWKHEEASVSMFEYLVDDNQLKEMFEQYCLWKTDVTFIKEQIAGPKSCKQDWPYEGRGKNKSFLYEVVANKRNGIDVDKWDYFARDCHGLGIRSSFDHLRCIKFARVLSVDGQLQICFKDKEAGNLYDMFHTRQTLHRRAYQHPVNILIGEMLKEALVKANDHLFFEGKNGAPKTMSKCTTDMVAYMKLTDYVVQQILLSDDPKLRESQEIIKNIMKRKLYTRVAQSQPKPGKSRSVTNIPKIQDELFANFGKLYKGDVSVNKDDIFLLMISVDYGKKEENPIDYVRFYSKNKPNEAVMFRKDQVSRMLPETFAEKIITVCSKICDEGVIEVVRKVFTTWCNENDMKEAKTGKDMVEFTPQKRKTSSQEQSSPQAHHKKVKSPKFIQNLQSK